MINTAAQAVAQNRAFSASRQVLLLVGASLLMAVLARLSMPLPFTPVVLTLSNLGVLLLALTLGSRRAAAAMLLYLAEGAMGLPVFSAGPGGIAQLLGPTGGYLFAYPVAAFVAGLISERLNTSILRLSLAAIVGEIIIFTGGIGYLMALGIPAAQATVFGLYPFAFGEIIKVMCAVAASSRTRSSAALNALIR